MNILLFLLSMLLPTAAGAVFFSREKELSCIERAVLSFAVGTALLSFALFVLMRLHISFTPLGLLSFLFLFLFVIVGFLPQSSRTGMFTFPRHLPRHEHGAWRSLVAIVLAGFIAIKLLFALFMIVSGPTVFGDAYLLWNYKAKVLFYENMTLQSSGGDTFLRGDAAAYPLHLPIMRAWTAFVMGTWSESFINLHSFVLFCCLLGLTYAFLKKRSGNMVALLLTAMLSCIPVLVYNVISGYADLAVGFFFLCAALLLYYWHRTRRVSLLAYAGILAAAAMFTKNEGIAIVFPSLCLSLPLYGLATRPGLKASLAGLGAFFLCSGIIVFWLHDSGALQTIISASGIRQSAVTFHAEGLLPLMQHLFLYRSFNLFWFGVLLVVALNAKSAITSDARFFFLPALFALAAILFVFLFTPNVAWLLDGTAINRTLLIVVPMLTVACGLLFAPAYGKDPR